MSASYDRDFRFYDNREKYLLFVSTCSEKQVIAERVALDIRGLEPAQPALRVFDAGMGDGTVLTRLMRDLHRQYPTVPFLIVGKEISQEDIRISLEKMADRFYEHPQTVPGGDQYALFRSALAPARIEGEAGASQLAGGPARGQLGFRVRRADQWPGADCPDWWKTTPSERTGNPLYEDPSGARALSQGPRVAVGAGHPSERGLAPRI